MCFPRSAQRVAGADLVEIGHGCVIARQQQVIAVVDVQAQAAVEIRPAAAAGDRPGFIDDDPTPRFDQRERRSQAGEAGSDDMDRGHASP